MPRWLFTALSALTPGFVRLWLLRWIFDDIGPHFPGEQHVAPWAIAFALRSYPTRVEPHD